MRQRLVEHLEGYAPPPVPLERIERRARRIRLRRAGAAAGVAAVAAVAAAISLPSAPFSRPSGRVAPVSITNGITTSAGPDGVFASGTVSGKHWRLAVQNIAGPGYRCVPAVTLNGNNADPVFTNPHFYTPVGNPSFVIAGTWAPGAGFAFIQVPDGVPRLRLDPNGVGGLQVDMRPVTVTACGERFRLVGFAYPLTGTIRVIASGVAGSYTAPATVSDPRNPATDGMWQNVGSTHDHVASAALASGPFWSIQVAFGAAGDCYNLLFGPGNSVASVCVPVSTPRGLEAIAALPCPGQGTGYAVAVSPGTARLEAEFSDGSTIRVTPVVVYGRKYAAVFVPGTLKLRWLAWLDTAGRLLNRSNAVPQPYWYVQVQP